MEIEGIGETAGKIWRHLAKAGTASIVDLGKAIEADPATLHLALGWLAREDKLVLERPGKSVVVRLKESTILGG